MRSAIKPTLALLCGSLGWAQLQTNSIEITTSRTLAATPDQASFSVRVDTGLGATLADVANVLSSTGITADNFVNLTPAFLNPRYDLEWNFNLTIPLSKISSTVAQLTSLPTRTTSFTFSGVTTSAAAQPTCRTADLVADASAQAQKLADAANLRLGPVLAISDAGGPVGVLALPSGFTLSGFLRFAIISQNKRTCVATVKFGIVRL